VTSIISSVLVSAVMFVVPRAAADSTTPTSASSEDEVQHWLDIGNRDFKAGRWAAARAAFEHAYALEPRPSLRFSIASTYRHEGKRAEAVFHYSQFLGEAPAGDPYRRVAEVAIREIEASTQVVPRSGPGWMRAVGWGSTIAGVVLAGTAVWQAKVARDDQADLEARPPGAPWDQRQEDTYAHGERAASRARWLGIGGAAMAGVGVTFLIFGYRTSDAERSRVSARIDPGASWSVSWSTSF
jgi:tetratricopeptide (TPR) repeat protein